MPDKKITDLDPATNVNAGDLLEVVNNPGSNPVSVKATAQQVTGAGLTGRTDLIQRVEWPCYVLKSPANSYGTAFTLVNSTAYWVFVGRAATGLTVDWFQVWLATQGAVGASPVAEWGLFSTTQFPLSTCQDVQQLVFTKIYANNDLLALINPVGVKFNSTGPAGATVPAGTILWLGLRIANYTTAPQLAGLAGDFRNTFCYNLASATSFMSASQWTANPTGPGGYVNTNICPDLRASLRP